MKRIGLLSDTHGYVHPRVFDFFASCDEIWHAGDIGNTETADVLSAFKPIRAVHGNIDDYKVRLMFPEVLQFEIEGLSVFMVHIGGYPGRYAPGIREKLLVAKPGLFISGHSHILKVVPDPRMKLLHINPGACGKQGMHTKITLVKFEIDQGRPKNLEIMEIERKGPPSLNY
ncbi:MAG: metallophosphatase family protein [Bacteroidetes bacterium]|nr:metallophosphoesterase family protein [Bacteroidales bacterium]MBU1008564.1 metallophosphatase family protein [Bacteroidota bacterium]